MGDKDQFRYLVVMVVVMRRRVIHCVSDAAVDLLTAGILR